MPSVTKDFTDHCMGESRPIQLMSSYWRRVVPSIENPVFSFACIFLQKGKRYPHGGGKMFPQVCACASECQLNCGVTHSLSITEEKTIKLDWWLIIPSLSRNLGIHWETEVMCLAFCLVQLCMECVYWEMKREKENKWISKEKRSRRVHCTTRCLCRRVTECSAVKSTG